MTRLTNGSFDSRPSPSPDGRYLAFHRPDQSGSFEVRILDRRTNTLTPFTARGIDPEWSPDGSVIAYQDYLAGFLRIVRPDGTGGRDFPSPFFAHSMAWSPEGDLLLGLIDGGLGLFDPSTGVVIRLPGSRARTDPAWRPGS